MGNYRETKAELRNYLTARVPLVLVSTWERDRVGRMLRELARELHTEIAYYTDARQIVNLPGGTSKDVDRDPLEFGAQLIRGRRGATLALGDVKRIGDDGIYSREILNLVGLCVEQAGTLILVTADPVWPRIGQLGMVTVLDYPDMDERRTQIAAFRERYGGRFPIRWDEDDLSRAAMLMRGFSEQQIENVLSTLLIERGSLGREDLSDLTGQKRRIYTAAAAIEPVKVPKELEVSGLGNLKRWLEERKRLFFLPDDTLHARGLETPKGILLAGVPGCGKSFSAKMVARAWELPLYRFDVGGVYDKWVGESERKMKEALQFIDNVAPCVVWIDEIEKALSVSDGGNDTGKRVLGQFLFWLQESSSRVFLIATANDISQLPPELFRKGRFSEVFFLDLPDARERRETIRQYAARCLRRTLPEDWLEELTKITEGFSYADLEYAVKEAAQYALLYGDDAVTQDVLRSRFQAILPFATTNPDAVQRLRTWGRNRAVAASEQTSTREADTK